jgi:methyltransferase OMS1
MLVKFSFFSKMAKTKIPLIIASLGLYSTCTFAGYHAYRIYKMPVISNCHLPENQKSKSFDFIASTYDEKINMDEWILGMYSKRKKLLSLASGNVLEVSAGTGRNLEFYNTPTVLIDNCEEMLKMSLPKAKKDTKFLVMSATDLSFADDTFDTVVDTFGLCSVSDPVKALLEMKRVCKKNGRILLLEHGKGHYNWLNVALDKTSHDHASKWGCWWNRDIVSILKSAGLGNHKLDRYHFGTTYSIVIENCDNK